MAFTPQRTDSTEWACNKCPVRVSADEISFLVSAIGEEVDNVIRKTFDVNAVESLLEKLENFLHPNHYHMFALKHSLIQLYGNHRDFSIESLSVESLMRKLKLCNDLLEGAVKKLDPHHIRLSIYTAVILLEKFNAIV